MNIAMFSDSYLPYASGVVKSVETFVKELEKQGETVYIIAPAYPHYFDNNSRIIRFPSYRFSRNSDFRLAFPGHPNLIKGILNLKLDIIHSHSPFLLGGLAKRLAKKIKVPLVFTYHTLYSEYLHYCPWLPKTLTRRFVSRVVDGYCRSSQVVLAPTMAVKNLLRASGIENKVEVLATGVDLEEFNQPVPDNFRARFQLPPTATLLLFVGRLGKEKNLPSLLVAVREVIHQMPNTFLLLVGSGPEENSLKRYAGELGLTERVIFAGELPHVEVIAAYKSSDLFVFSSLTEAQGLVLSEALAAGLPIVAMKAQGASYMVRDGIDGILTKPNAQDLAQAIIFLLEHPAMRKSMSRKALERRKSLSATRQTKQLLKIYQEATHSIL